MILYLVRHGETDFNIQNRYGGSMDVPLNKNGLHQAEMLADKLSDISFDVIITSPLIRARQTADIISSVCKIPYYECDEFAERNLGVYEGLTEDEIKVKYPELYARQCTRNVNDAPTNGETIKQFDERISRAIDSLKNKYSNNKVLLVSHGYVAMIINKNICGLRYEEMRSFVLGNCEVVEYEI